MISYDEQYAKWLYKKGWEKMCSEAQHIGIIYIGRETSFDLLDEAFKNKISIIEVYYTVGRIFHMALLLYRESHPEGGSVLEYIDSMPCFPDNKFRNDFEMQLKENCTKRNVYYIGSDYMYNGMSDENNFNWQPPMCLQNLLTDRDNSHKYKELMEKYDLASIKGKIRSKTKPDDLQSFSGGNCKFWAYLIADNLICFNVTSRCWMSKFIKNVKQTPESVSMWIVKKLACFVPK